MKFEVKLFAGAKQAAGTESVEVELSDGATIADLRQAILARYPELRAILSHALFAQEMEFAGEDAPLRPGAEIACIPPVSGG